VHAILAQLEKVRDVFAAAKELGGGRAASGLVNHLPRVCGCSNSSILDNASATLLFVSKHHRQPRRALGPDRMEH
jgi:hypothetical protein